MNVSTWALYYWRTWRALVIWNGQDVIFPCNIFQYTKNLVMLIPTSSYTFFRMHVMSFYGIKTWFMKLHKEDLNNISVVCPKPVKRLCCRDSYNSNIECHEYARLAFFKHFPAWKFIYYAHRVLTSKSQCLMIHKH